MADHYEDLELDPSDDDNEDDADDADRAKKTSAKHVTRVACAIGWCTTIVSLVLIIALSWGTGMPGSIAARNKARVKTNSTANKTYKPWEIGVVSSVTGVQDLNQLNAEILAVIAFGCVVLATCVSTLEVNRNPELVPPDFESKGTLSNVSQDIKQPNGRMFSVGLFTFALLLITSSYTTWLYRSWAPYVDANQPFNGPSWQPKREKICRAIWVSVPNTLFMFTAAFPSFSDASGYRFYLMLTHNICAPLAMAVVVIMETIQLQFGENAFRSFWSSEPATSLYGPLTVIQRARVVVASCTWCCFIVFLGVQVYLGLGSMLGLKIKTCYALALISYYGEVIGMNLVAALPALAGFDMRLADAGLPSFSEAIKILSEL